MKLYAPLYYEKFKCIADKCTNSCCVGWEIDVDENTFKKYKKSKCQYAVTACESIEISDTPHFKLSNDEKCPHLDEKGLCKIIINMGEDYLCDICREHPRFYNYTNYGCEVGLGMSCPEACRIILSSDGYDEFNVVARGEGSIERIEFDSLAQRDKIYKILKNKELRFDEKLKTICNDYEIDLMAVNENEYVDCINSLEYLNDSHRSLFSAFSLNTERDKSFHTYLERALAYFIYRHCTEAMDYEEHRISLAFCLFLENLLASLIANKDGDVFEIARIISEEIEYSTDNAEKIKEIFEI